MLIDWFTVIAQAINFLVLMYLLKRFLYKPVLDAIDEREARIVETVRNAERDQASAKAEREIFAKKNEDFDRRRVELAGEAREEARAAGERLMEKERLAANALREKWLNSLADEQKRFGDETIRRIQGEIFAVVRQVLSDLADASLEERMVEVFDRRLRQAWKAPSDKLAAALRSAPAAVRVKSAFELAAPQQEFLRRTLSETFAENVDVGFETKPELVGGIELVVDGQRVAWTVDDYLDRLESGVSHLPDASSSPLAAAAMKTPIA